MSPSPPLPGALLLGGSFPVLGAARCLAQHGVRVGVAGPPRGLAQFSRTVDRYEILPDTLPDEAWRDALVQLAVRHGWQGWVLLPSSDPQLRRIAQYHASLSTHFALTTRPWDTIQVLYDKRLTYARARELQIPVPATEIPGRAESLDASAIRFPLVLKPALSHAFVSVTRHKAYRANTPTERRQRFAAMAQVIPPAEIILQELVPDPAQNLHSFAGYYRDGALLAGLAVKRPRQWPLDFGRTSTYVEIVDRPELSVLATRLLGALRFTGLVEVEFMQDAATGQFLLLDVNARLWAWHTLLSAAGLNLPYFAYADALGQPFPVPSACRSGSWIRLATDMRAAAHALRAGQLTLRHYAHTLAQANECAVFRLNDPGPALMEPILLVLAALRPPAAPPERGS